MSTNNNVVTSANDALVGGVSAKQYFTKLASINVHPANNDEAIRLMKMGDAIHNAVELVGNVIKKSDVNTTKQAVDAVFETKVVKKASNTDKVDVASYLTVPDIVNAAKALITEGTK